MIRAWRSRIGREIAIGPWWFHIHLAIHPAMWAGSFHIARKCVWLRPIDYAAVRVVQ